MYFWELSRNWDALLLHCMWSESWSELAKPHNGLRGPDVTHRHESSGQNPCLDILSKPHPSPHKAVYSGQLWLEMTHTGGLPLLPVAPSGLKLNSHTSSRLIPPTRRYCSLPPASVHPCSLIPCHQCLTRGIIIYSQTIGGPTYNSLFSHLQSYPFFWLYNFVGFFCLFVCSKWKRSFPSRTRYAKIKWNQK